MYTYLKRKYLLEYLCHIYTEDNLDFKDMNERTKKAFEELSSEISNLFKEIDTYKEEINNCDDKINAKKSEINDTNFSGNAGDIELKLKLNEEKQNEINTLVNSLGQGVNQIIQIEKYFNMFDALFQNKDYINNKIPENTIKNTIMPFINDLFENYSEMNNNQLDVIDEYQKEIDDLNDIKPASMQIKKDLKLKENKIKEEKNFSEYLQKLVNICQNLKESKWALATGPMDISEEQNFYEKLKEMISLSAETSKEEDPESLQTSILKYSAYDQLTLAKKIENHPILEFKRISALVYRKNKKYAESIEISKKLNFFKDAIDTALESKKEQYVNELLKFFGERKDKESFAACLYTCYEYIKPDVAMEVAWRYGMTEMCMPFMIQTMRDFSRKINTMEIKNDVREQKDKEEKKHEAEGTLDMNMFMGSNAMMIYQPGMQNNAGMGMGGMGSNQGMGGFGMPNNNNNSGFGFGGNQGNNNSGFGFGGNQNQGNTGAGFGFGGNQMNNNQNNNTNSGFGF